MPDLLLHIGHFKTEAGYAEIRPRTACHLLLSSEILSELSRLLGVLARQFRNDRSGLSRSVPPSS